MGKLEIPSAFPSLGTLEGIRKKCILTKTWNKLESGFSLRAPNKNPGQLTP